MSIFAAEFVGTALLVLLGCGVCANVNLRHTLGNNAGWIVVTTGWATAVATAVYCVGQWSGAHLNPAVTLGLLAIGQVGSELVVQYIGGQMAGAFIGATLVWLAYYPHWEMTPDAGAKLGTFATRGALPSPHWNFVTEAIGTGVLVFGVLLIGRNAGQMKGDTIDLSSVFATGINPALVGMLVWAIGLCLGGPTGYAINPARDLGPRLAHATLPIAGKGDSNWRYAWVPVLGPIAGGVAGALLFQALVG